MPSEMKPSGKFGRWSGVSLAAALAFLAAAGPVPAHAVEGPPPLRVDYDPPRLSVEARGVRLADVVSEIGAKVGFTVVERAASSEVVTLSIKDVSVDVALRQILRGENYTVLYLADAGPTPGSAPAIDTIVLLGEPGRLGVTVESGDRPQDEGGSAAASSARDQPSLAVVSPALTPSAGSMPWSPDSTSLLSRDWRATADGGIDPSNPPITVGDVLKAHAMAAAQAAQAPDGGPPAPSSPPASLEAVLAETTRRAQQSLSALLDGLATATRSLNESLASGRK